MGPMSPRRSMMRKAVRLAAWRLTSSLSWKVARAMAVMVSVGLTLAVVVLGVKGRSDGVQSVVARACVLVAWVTMPLVAAWSAKDREGIDRADGVEELAGMHGIARGDLRVGRGLAATMRLSMLVFAATAPVLLAVVASASSLGAALQSAIAIAPLAGFALGVGVVGGGLATACGGLSPSRGRTLWLAVVLVPWMLDGVLTHARAQVGSLPGLLVLMADLAGHIRVGP